MEFGDRFSDAPVFDQLGLTGRFFQYEGRTTTAARVSRGNVAAARAGIGRSRARTAGGLRRAAVRGGARFRGTQLARERPARRLTGAEVTARTAARRGRAQAGTSAGRRRTRSIIARARRQGAAGR